MLGFAGRTGGYTDGLPGRGGDILTSDSEFVADEKERPDPAGDPPLEPSGFPLLVSRAGEIRCGIPLGRVREVVRSRKVARVPEARAPIRGLLNVRGDMVTVVELAGLQELLTTGGKAGPARSPTTGVTTGSIRPGRVEAVVVLRTGGDPIGLEVDGVEDIRDFAGQAAPVPEGGGSTGRLNSTTGTYTQRIWAGIVTDDRGEIGVLDPGLALEAVHALAEPTEVPAPLEVDDSDGNGDDGSGPVGGRDGDNGVAPEARDRG